MKHEPAHTKLVESIVWIQQHLAPLELKFGQRRHLVLPCYDLAIEHMTAIDVLYRSQLTGSMFALLRSLFESVIRGLWLDRCASETQLEQFRKHKLERTFSQMIQEIESTFSTDNKTLSSIQAKTWSALNGYTHTGYNQVLGRHGDGTLGASYQDEEITSALNFAAIFGLVAAGQLADAAQKPQLVAEAARLLRSLENAA